MDVNIIYLIHTNLVLSKTNMQFLEDNSKPYCLLFVKKQVMEEITDYTTYTREQLADEVVQINSPLKQKEQIYAIMDALGISYKKTNCGRCMRDYLNILREELGLIESAAEASDFNCEGSKRYRYIRNRTVLWRGHKMNQHTKPEVIEEFLAAGIKGYYVEVV